MRAPAFHHPRLVNEATMLATEAILHSLPAPHSCELDRVSDQRRQTRANEAPF